MDMLTNPTKNLHETGPPFLLSPEEFLLCNETLDLGQAQNCLQGKFEDFLQNFIQLANQGNKETFEYLARELDNKNGAKHVLAIMARIGLSPTAEFAIEARIWNRTA